MSLPFLDRANVKVNPQHAITKDTDELFEGVLVQGTGYPYYGWLPPHGKCLVINHPRHPAGHPLREGIVAVLSYTVT